jgi:hypothetical protein
MPDNRDLLKERLGEMELVPGRREEILRELGDHLEDHAAALQAGGLAPADAVQKALDSVSDWPAFRDEILAAEHEEATMNYQVTHRVRALWLPALGALALSGILLAIFRSTGLIPGVDWLSIGSSAVFVHQSGSVLLPRAPSLFVYIPWLFTLHQPGLVLLPQAPSFFAYTPWLLTLPILGAIAAAWSRRAGGKARHRALAALAPAFGWLGLLLISPVISSLITTLEYLRSLQIGHSSLPLANLPTAYSVLLWSLVLGPPILLLLGAAPFLRKPQARV